MIKFTLSINSYTDIITNSSSEIFCSVICTKLEVLHLINNYLNDIGIQLHLPDYERYDEPDEYRLEFWIDYLYEDQGSNLEKVVIPALKYILNQKFNENDYKLELYSEF